MDIENEKAIHRVECYERTSYLRSDKAGIYNRESFDELADDFIFDTLKEVDPFTRELKLLYGLDGDENTENFGFISLNKMFEISEFYFYFKKSERSTLLLKKLM
jgi:hypothetical protein